MVKYIPLKGPDHLNLELSRFGGIEGLGKKQKNKVTFLLFEVLYLCHQEISHSFLFVFQNIMLPYSLRGMMIVFSSSCNKSNNFIKSQ